MNTVAIRTLWKCCLRALLVVMLGFRPVSADELRLRDGSRIFGTIVKKDNGVLEFKTSYAGTIKIKWTEIKEIKADKPFKVMLKNDEINLIVNTTEGKQAISDSYSIRRTALLHKVFYMTTMAGAAAMIQAMARTGSGNVNRLQDLHEEVTG